MRAGSRNNPASSHHPSTSGIANELPGTPQRPFSRPPMIGEVSQLTDPRDSNPYVDDQMTGFDLSHNPDVPIVESPIPYESSVQNGRPHPYMSVEDGLRVKRDRDKGKYSKYPGWDDIQTMDSTLRGRDHALLIDNAASMSPHYEKARKVTELLSFLTKPYDPNGLDLYFTTDVKKYKPTSNKKVLRYFDEHPPKGMADMRARFASIIEPYQAQFGKKDWAGRLFHRNSTPSKGPRQFSLYVLTDGVWDPECTLITEVKALVAALQKAGMANKHIGIQFIRFGNSPEGKRRLETLDSGLGLELDVIDTTPADGNVWKMLLGAVNDWFDDDHKRPSSGRNHP
ncbi:MAG: hypothetical protein Q9218_003673 [Villophora microphyllina]